MPWTDPKTWSAGETLTAANFNTHIRDDFNSVEHLIARKTADESVVSSIVFQDDDHLFFSVAANEVWQFELIMYVTGLFDFQGQFTFPSGSIMGFAWGTPSGGASTAIVSHTISSTSTPSASWFMRAASTSIANSHIVRGVFTNSGTSGTFRLQWSQATSGATATIAKTNSTLMGVKLA